MTPVSAPFRGTKTLPTTGGWKQMGLFPTTRYMGSKYKLLPFLWQHTKALKFDAVLDAFSGSACVGYMYKAQGKAVATNDLLRYAAHSAKATIENDSVTLEDKDIAMLLGLKVDTDGFIRTTFKDLYFTEDENHFLEQAWHRIHLLDDPYKQSLALASLCRACIKKRPRGVFTYTGDRYDDGRKDLRTTLQDHFVAAIHAFNAAVFSNAKPCASYRGNVFDLERKDFDLVYIDPPYFSTQSDNDYLRRYHFVEGLCSYWKESEIQMETLTKKIKKEKTSFDTKAGIDAAFHRLFAQFPQSTLAISYSSNCLPAKPEMLKILKEYRPHVSVKEFEHFYSFGNQGHKVSDNKNAVTEYLFIASHKK
jgi:DNA adenine methylase